MTVQDHHGSHSVFPRESSVLTCYAERPGCSNVCRFRRPLTLLFGAIKDLDWSLFLYITGNWWSDVVRCHKYNLSSLSSLGIISSFWGIIKVTWGIMPAGPCCWLILGCLLLTYSKVQSPTWEANWFVASQEIPRISRNPKVHYRTHKRPPPFSILGQPNPIHYI